MNGEKKATVVFINPAGYIGGAEKSLLDLARRLPEAGFRPLIVALGPGPLEEEARRRGVESVGVHLPPVLLSASRKSFRSALGALLVAPFCLLPILFRLRAIIRARRARIIHTNGLKAHVLGCALALLTGEKLIWHFRDFLEGYPLRLFRGLGRIFPDRTIANSRAVKERLGNLGKISVVYNGVEGGGVRSGDREAFRREFGWGEGEKVIGTVGHFAPLKGQEDFVRAAAAVIASAPRSRFLIVGEAIYPGGRDYKLKILDLISALGLCGKMVCPGPRDDLAPVLAALDIFVLPSWSEGFGRSNLEAMAAGVPVVSTAVGGIPEVVADGETGLLVPPRDPAALAAAILRLVEDESLRKKMGEAGRERAALFSVEKMVAGVVEVYRSLETAKKHTKY